VVQLISHVGHGQAVDHLHAAQQWSMARMHLVP
jgi:hypothetical protein